MITRADIERIQNLPDNVMVLMAVIDVNPAIPDNEGTALQTRVKARMLEAGVPPTVMNQVLADLRDAQMHSGKSAFYLVGEDMFERYDIQADLPERFHYGRPLKSMLTNVLDLLPTVAVLAVDREWARLFLLQQGELTEVRREENVHREVGERWDTLTAGTRHVPGTPGATGSAQGSGPRSDSGMDLFRRREDAMQQRFYNEMAAELGDILRLGDIRELILVGPAERVAAFRAEIPEKAPFEVIGETNVVGGAGWVNPREILDKIQPILEQHRRRTEEQVLKRIREHGVMELERVLEMMQEGRIYQLVIPEDGSQFHLYRSHNREVPYFTGKKDVAQSPLDGSLMERVTLEEVLPDLIDLYGLQVIRLHGDQANRLIKDFGGVAGLPRY
ncbi:MAG: VLRF1 family aeRF1-type release factor [Deinococcota bacterium]